MKQRFFVFVSCLSGRAPQVAAKIVDDCKLASEVTLTSGSWDILVRSECDHDVDIGRFLVQPIQCIEGVTRTKTEVAYAVFDPADIYFDDD